jgi:hypothetical protein
MKLYTWKSPGDRKQYQIDYSFRDVKTLPGADIDSDHNLLVAEVQTRLKAIRKAGKRMPKWNLEQIKSKEIHEKEVMEQTFSQIDGITDSIEDN